ncbi:FUSC family protein [Trinickia mobilis]|uniref:FUSC family protein n=1 Tax=Trinickia mobilis TaxID=2816356 RepID=UPI001A8FCB85|nr:FUSC family protein [Trinickia mobilis]
MNARRLFSSGAGLASEVRTALADWVRSGGMSWLHVLKTVAAALLAMGLAMRLELPAPRTAMVTVFIVMQPQTGMVLAKSFYRFAGTVVGAVVTVALTAVFGQVPELFLLSIALWIGVCTFGAALNRNFRSYGFVLAGYTTALIGIPALAHPDGVFLSAMTRLSEVSMGILCAATISALVFPQRVADTVRDTVRARYTRFAQFVTDTLSRGRHHENAREVHTRFAADVVSLEALTSVAVFEDWGTRMRAGRMARLNTEFMNVSTRFRALQQWLGRIQAQGGAAVVDAIDACLRDVPPLLAKPDNEPIGSAADAAHAVSQLQAFRGSLPKRLSLSRARLEHLPDATPLEFDTAAELLERFVDEMHSYTETYASLAVDSHKRELSTKRFVSKTNLVAGGVAGLRAAVALLSSAGLWYETAWTSGAGAVLNTAVNSALVGTMPQPAAAASQMAWGTLVAAIVAVTVLFGVYPNIDGYVLLCVVLAPVLMFGVYITTRPGGMGFGLGYCISLCVLAGPDNAMNYNIEGVINDGLALVASMMIVTVASAVIFPPARPWLRKRLLRDLLDQVVAACTGGLPRARLHLESRTRDLVHQLNGLSTEEPAFQAAAASWMFTVLDVGHAVIELRSELAIHPEAWQGTEGACRCVLDSLALLFDAPTAANLTAAREAVDAAVSAVREASQTKRASPDARARFQRMSGYLHFIRVTLAELPSPSNADAHDWLEAFLARR